MCFAPFIHLFFSPPQLISCSLFSSFHFLIHLYTLCSVRMLSKSKMRRLSCRPEAQFQLHESEAKRDFYCRLFFFLSLSFVLFYEILLFYGLPSSEIGFSLMFSYTLSLARPSPHLPKSASCAHRASEEFVWGQHYTKHFSFSSLPSPPESLILRTIFHLFPSFIRFALRKFVTHLRKDRFSARFFCAKLFLPPPTAFYFQNI